MTSGPDLVGHWGWRHTDPSITKWTLPNDRSIEIKTEVFEHVNEMGYVDQQSYGDTTVTTEGFTVAEVEEFMALWVVRREREAQLKLQAFMRRFGASR